MNKFYKYLLIAVVYLGTCQTNMAQNQVTGLDKEQLIGRSYREIELLEDDAFQGDRFNLLRKYTDVHVMKAKREGNAVQIGRGYFYRTIIEDAPLALVYADSIIEATRKSSDPDFPTLGFIQKGEILYNNGNFQLALDNYLEAYKLSLDKHNNEDQRLTSQAIAAIRNVNGQPHIAADLYRRSLELLKLESNYETDHYEEYITLLFNLSLAHLRMFQLDSATFYSGIGLNESLLTKDTIYFRDFVFVDAEINYFKGNYQEAKDSLLAHVDQVEGTDKAIKLYYLGKIEQQSGNIEQAIGLYKKIDSIVEVTGDPIDEIKDVYHQLAMQSILEGNRQMQIDYIGKLMHYDSVLSSKQKGIMHRATIAYDIPYLKLQKELAIKQLKKKNRWNIVLGILAILGIFLGVYFYFRARNTRTKIQKLLDGPIIRKISNEHSDGHPASVPEQVRNNLLKKLDEFESSEGFMGKELDLSSLAHDLGTNTTYLSILINHYKRMTFPNYIKDLKITRAIDRLSEDADLLKYSNPGLADVFGFKSSDSFSRAFYEKTGVFPSKFIKVLNARNRRSFINGGL